MIAVRARKPGRAGPADAGGGPPLCGCGVRVDAEERLHLINACAFFRAERFRATAPGRIRGGDVKQAARDIDRALKGRGRSRSR